jgi:hypothetical protein
MLPHARAPVLNRGGFLGYATEQNPSIAKTAESAEHMITLEAYTRIRTIIIIKKFKVESDDRDIQPLACVKHSSWQRAQHQNLLSSECAQELVLRSCKLTRF